MIIEVEKSSDGFYWRLKSPNGRIMAHSQNYKKHQNAMKTAVTLAKSFLHNTDCNIYDRGEVVL